MKEFEVWAEGYVTTGQRSSAIYHGKWKGNTFKEAVINFANSLSKESKATINLDNLTFWGCRFFDNEKDASKTFG